MRRAFLKVFAVGLAASMFVGAADAQEAAFGGIAGNWEGMHSSLGVKLELSIVPTGAFVVTSRTGADSGVARMEGSQIVMSFTKNVGGINVSKSGENLKGTITIANAISAVTFSRKN